MSFSRWIFGLGGAAATTVTDEQKYAVRQQAYRLEARQKEQRERAVQDQRVCVSRRPHSHTYTHFWCPLQVANEAESARLRKEAAWLQTERMALAALEADLDKQRITLEAERKSIAEQRESVAFDKALVSALLEEAEESHENSVAAYEAAQQYAKAALIAIAAAPQTTQMRSNLKRVKMESSA